MRKKTEWEYKVEYIPIVKCEMNGQSGEDVVLCAELKDFKYKWQLELEEILNSQGADGWELVCLTDSLLGFKNVDGFGIFKRKKNQEDV